MKYAIAICLAATSLSLSARAEKPNYVMAKAYHILPETTSEESGYFSLSEGLDGSIYIGTAKYNHDAYLVEFEPRTEKQRVALDTNKVCGLSATGYAAQAKLHTRNFVGASGKIYVGSKQGEPTGKVDLSTYPGGYVMTYDPRTGETANLGVPYPHQGVIDVMADEDRDKLYAVTCEDQHWMMSTLKGGKYRELGPILTPFAATLIDADGRAQAITKDFQLATYDPATDKVTVRPIELDGKPFKRVNDLSIPIWVLTPDHRRAYMVQLNDPTLIEIDFATCKAVSHGLMVQGKHPDCRCGFSLAPDGKVYALVRVDNDTGFGSGFLHHLARFDPSTGKHEDLGVLAVSNPDYYPWDKKLPYSHGFHRLPDGTLTPLHHHMALMVAHDGTIYATILYPFTLMRIDAYKLPVAAATPASRALQRALESCEHAEAMLPQVTKFAEVVAKRHMAGGQIGFPVVSQSLAPELCGRSGGLVNIGFDRVWKKTRSEAERAQDVGLAAFDRTPSADELAILKQFKHRGGYLIGIGPSSLSHIAPCDAWLDSGDVSGRSATLANAVVGWELVAETVGALTRHGKMPPIWKGFTLPDARAWAKHYLDAMQFDDSHHVPAQEAGKLGGAWLRQLRYSLRRMEQTQVPSMVAAGADVHRELAAGRKIVVVWQGHLGPGYVGKFGDGWTMPEECHPFLDSQVESYRKETPDGALVISLGSAGLEPAEAKMWRSKNQRVIHLCGDHPDPAWRDYSQVSRHIDLNYALGDACVALEGYPVRLFAPSGILQLAAYDAIVSEAEAR